MISVRHYKIGEAKIEILGTHYFNIIELHTWNISPYHVIENYFVNVPMF
jgi:hypothetical protein